MIHGVAFWNVLLCSGFCWFFPFISCLVIYSIQSLYLSLSAHSAGLHLVFLWPAAISVRQVSPRSVSVTVPGSDRPVTYEIYTLLPNGQRQFLSRTSSSSSPKVVTINVTPGTVYRFVAQSIDRTTGLRSPLSNVVTLNVPGKAEEKSQVVSKQW